MFSIKNKLQSLKIHIECFTLKKVIAAQGLVICLSVSLYWNVVHTPIKMFPRWLIGTYP